MPPEIPPPERVRPRIERGVPTRLRKQGLFKPQHRVVLFLLAASAGSFLLTILFPPKDDAAAAEASRAAPAVPAGPVVFPRERGALLPLLLPEGATPGPLADSGTLVTAAQALAPKLAGCAASHAAALAPLDGRLVVRAEVGPAGLQRAGLADVAEADAEAVACLAVAAWRHAWPSRDPAESVQVPFYVVAPLDTQSPPAERSGPVLPTAP